VAFESTAPDLVPGQSGFGRYNAFLFDRDSGEVTLVSHVPGSATTGGNGDSVAPSLNADGSRITFWGRATDLGFNDTNGLVDVFLADRATGEVTLVSHAASASTTAADGDSVDARLSADGACVVFQSWARDLVAGQTDPADTLDVFLYDVAAGTTSLVSPVPASLTTAANGSTARDFTFSDDAGFIAFTSSSTDQVTGQTDANSNWDVFLFERATGTVRLVSHAAGSSAGSSTTAGRDESSRPFLSGDGSWIGFESEAPDLVAGQGENVNTDLDRDIFLQETSTGITRVVSHVPGGTLPGGNFATGLYGLSTNGRFVVFYGFSTGLVWGPGEPQEPAIFLYDRETGENVLVSHALGSPTQPGNQSSYSPVLSADGSTVVFNSLADDLIPDDLNLDVDIFAYDNGRPGRFFTLPPCRLFDTRRPQDGPALASGASTVLHLHNACSVPETAKALAVNVTVVQPTAPGHLTLYRGEMTAPPVASTLNFGPGQVRANNAIVRLAASAVAVAPDRLHGGLRSRR
jgi:Tol biopolymer transport system component